MAQSQNDSINQEAQLLPTKDTLTALKSDVNLESATLELCDNALDAWERTSGRSDRAEIRIDVTERDGRTELVIRDNAGGVPREEAAMLFGLGRTVKEGVGGSIGTYGVGAKKSLVNLGVPFRISSRTRDESVGWTYQITEEWFEDDHDWTVPVHDQPNIDPGVTEIRIQDLNYEWNDTTAEALRQRLGEAYNLFLSDEMQELHENEYDLDITVCGESVEAEGVPNWTHSPFDGIVPRRFENIQIPHPEANSPINLNITVGLLTKKDSQEAGTDIYCQKRKVSSSLRNNEGGFGKENHLLGNFNARHERLKVIVELETEGDAQLLPWDTQKSSIDKHSPIMRGSSDSRGVYNWLRRTVHDYYELDADKIPRAFVEPFDSDHEYAANGGQPIRLDYSDRKRVVSNHRPDTELSDISELTSQASAHATLWISAEDAIEDWKVPTYRTHLKQESNRKIENLTRVTNLPPESVVKSPHKAAGRINELARIHLEQGVYHPDNLEEWQIPRYREYIERHGEVVDNATEDVPDGVPLSTEELMNKSQSRENESMDSRGANNGQHRSSKEASMEEESAEIFVVLDRNGGDERVARLLNVSRQELCSYLDLDPEAKDETLWGELRTQIDSQLGGDWEIE